MAELQTARKRKGGKDGFAKRVGKCTDIKGLNQGLQGTSYSTSYRCFINDYQRNCVPPQRAKGD